jgi:hypothetical protein
MGSCYLSGKQWANNGDRHYLFSQFLWPAAGVQDLPLANITIITCVQLSFTVPRVGERSLVPSDHYEDAGMQEDTTRHIATVSPSGLDRRAILFGSCVIWRQNQPVSRQSGQGSANKALSCDKSLAENGANVPLSASLRQLVRGSNVT